MHSLLWDVQHFGMHVQLANRKTILCIQFIGFLSQVGENIRVRSAWHFGMHVQLANRITILRIQFNVFASDLYGRLQWLTYRLAIVNAHTDPPLIFYLLHNVQKHKLVARFSLF